MGLGASAVFAVWGAVACASSDADEAVVWVDTLGTGETIGEGDDPTGAPNPWPPGTDSNTSGAWPMPGTTGGGTSGDSGVGDTMDSLDIGCGDCVEDCLDGLDNDANGEVDCDDRACADHLACTCTQTLLSEFGRHVFCAEATDWAHARDQCEANGLHLVTIHDDITNTWLVDQSQAIDGSTSWWMGYSDLQDEGQWRWVDGGPQDYDNWHPGEPNNGVAGPEHCAAFPEHTAFAWNDLECDTPRPFICEQ
ncbi:MAG: hypothetical protein K0V04_45155 [Deltaproteobacteria bacterium]|nr:hypothetical protein [Deltaproteobacteria bacterium]